VTRTSGDPDRLDFAAALRRGTRAEPSAEHGIGAVQVTTTTAITAQPVETVCDECAGDGQLAYDLEATMWVPRSTTADWPADDCVGISMLDCLQRDGTSTVRLDPGRGHRPTRSGR